MTILQQIQWDPVMVGVAQVSTNCGTRINYIKYKYIIFLNIIYLIFKLSKLSETNYVSYMDIGINRGCN